MRYRLDTPFGEFAVRDAALGWALRQSLEAALLQGQVIRCARGEQPAAAVLPIARGRRTERRVPEPADDER